MILLDELDEDYELLNECNGETEKVKNTLIHKIIEDKIKQTKSDDENYMITTLSRLFKKSTTINDLDEKIEYDEELDNKEKIDFIMEEGKKKLKEKYGYEPSEDQLETYKNDYLQNLEEINLSFNDIASLPDSFGNLRNLDILDFDGNQLASLPESIGNLQNLHYLSLHGNNLVSLPESIGNLINLETLNLSGNLNLRSLPESIVNLTHVDLEISITDTAITSLPENLPENIMIFGFRQQRHAAVAAAEPQVDAYQIHRASSKIDYEKLVAFLKSKLRNLEFPLNFSLIIIHLNS
jgi:Leucine-rich repeat (LRR) protein